MMFHGDTFIDVAGIRVEEPVTAITDLMVTAVCIYAFAKLPNKSRSGYSVSYFKFYFLTMAIATLYGGIIGHAFFYFFTIDAKIPAWIMSMISIGLIERAAIAHSGRYMSKTAGQFFSWLNIVELTALIVTVLYTKNFFYVEAHAAYGLMLVVLSLEAYVFLKNKSEESMLMLVGVGVAAAAATVHLTKFTLHEWFNHLDLSHVLMAIAGFIFYKAVGTIAKT